jgi:hypothetical protein
MELLGEVGHVEPHFSLFGDSFSVGARLVDGLRQTYHMLGNHFGRTRWNCSVTWAMWSLVSVHLEKVLILTQDWCKVCAERTHRLRNHLHAPDGTPR